MAGKKDTPLAPQLRFPEFENQPLHDVRLRDVTSESRIRNGEKTPKFEVMGVSKTDGIVPMEKRLIASDTSRYKIVRKDWFVYNPMRLNIGSIARWSGDRDVLASPDYVVFSCNSKGGQKALSPDFFEQFRQSEVWEAFVNEGGDGGVRVRIYYDDIGEIRLGLPSLPEQQKIAECLGSLDDLIVAETQKLDGLRQHRRGLMQQLFPQPGETVPRLRFPEFQDTGKWLSPDFSDLYDFQRTNNLSRDKLNYVSGAVRNIHYGDIHSKFRSLFRLEEEHVPYINKNAMGAGFADEAFCQVGDMVIADASEDLNDVGKAIEILSLAGGRVVAGTHTILARRKKDFPTIGFGAYLFQSAIVRAGIKKQAQGTKVFGISPNRISSITVPLPQAKSEQQRIADCLSELDTRIGLQMGQIEALKQHKRGLLQQLFPPLEGKKR